MWRREISVLAMVTVLATSTLAAEPEVEKQSYTTREIEGWTVKINDRMLKEKPESSDQALKLLQVKLYDIARTVPAGPLGELKKVPIWFELEDAKHPCACYHASPEWLKANGYDTAKARSVQLAHPDTFVKWSIEQPWMVLHELAHAYHDRVLGFENAEIDAAFRKAREAKLYASVMRVSGSMEKAYAMNNAKEFFAELSECYWGTNDFFPFVRGELKQHDPESFELMKKMWSGKK